MWLMIAYVALFSTLKQTLCLHVILREWLTFLSIFLKYPLKWCTYSAGMAGATWNCSHLGASSVYTIQPFTFMQSHIHKVYHNVYLAVTCHLHFWQNDRDLLCATVVTWGWNGYQNKSAQKVNPGEENSPAAPAGIWTCDLSVRSPAL